MTLHHHNMSEAPAATLHVLTRVLCFIILFVVVSVSGHVDWADDHAVVAMEVKRRARRDDKDNGKVSGIRSGTTPTTIPPTVPVTTSTSSINSDNSSTGVRSITFRTTLSAIHSTTTTTTTPRPGYLTGNPNEISPTKSNFHPTTSKSTTNAFLHPVNITTAKPTTHKNPQNTSFANTTIPGNGTADEAENDFLSVTSNDTSTNSATVSTPSPPQAKPPKKTHNFTLITLEEEGSKNGTGKNDTVQGGNGTEMTATEVTATVDTTTTTSRRPKKMPKFIYLDFVGEGYQLPESQATMPTLEPRAVDVVSTVEWVTEMGTPRTFPPDISTTPGPTSTDETLPIIVITDDPRLIPNPLYLLDDYQFLRMNGAVPDADDAM